MTPSAPARAPVPPSASSLAVAFAIGLAAFLALRLPSAPALNAQAGWSFFDSSEAVPASEGISFTVRYPPGFVKDAVRPLRSPPGASGNFSQSFRSSDRAARTFVFLSATTLVLYPELKRLISERGYEAFFDITGNAVARRLSAREGVEAVTDGVSLFKYQGLQAADVRFSGTSLIPARGAFRMYGTERVVAKEGYHVHLTCAFSMPQADAAGKAYTSASHPASAPVCAPFLDSLEFKA
jgi:hypothetical protein